MPKFIPTDVLRRDYGLKKAEGVKNVCSCFATNAKWVKVTELEDERYSIMVASDETDQMSIFMVKDRDLMEKETMVFSNNITDVFVSIYRSTEESEKNAIVFLSKRMQKTFSQWLFDLDESTYKNICDNGEYLSTVKFKAHLTMDEVDRYFANESGDYDSVSVNMKGIIIPESSKLINLSGFDEEDPLDFITRFMGTYDSLDDNLIKCVLLSVKDNISEERICSLKEACSIINNEIHEDEYYEVTHYIFDTTGVGPIVLIDDFIYQLYDFCYVLTETERKFLDIDIIFDYEFS